MKFTIETKDQLLDVVESLLEELFLLKDEKDEIGLIATNLIKRIAIVTYTEPGEEMNMALTVLKLQVMLRQSARFVEKVHSTSQQARAAQRLYAVIRAGMSTINNH
jgi:hypothetical protein